MLRTSGVRLRKRVRITGSAAEAQQMARSRLDIYEDIAEPMYRAAPDVQQRAGRAAAEWAVARTGLSQPAVASALHGGPVEPAESLWDRLVEEHYELFQARDRGRATENDVTEAFDRMCAVGAVTYLARSEPAEAIFEAIQAAEDWSELREILQPILGIANA
jgi:hypothetical protein